MSETAKPDAPGAEAIEQASINPASVAEQQAAIDAASSTPEVLNGELETAEEIAQAQTEDSEVVEAEASIDVAASAGEVSVEALQGEVEMLRHQLQAVQDKAIRQHAEVENAKKRMQRELEDARKFALKNFAVELLPIKDSMEMHDTELLNAGEKEGEEINLANLREGSSLILKMLNTAMDKFNIEEINPLGEKFNPELHQAMSMMPSPDAEPNTVLIVHQKGYQLNGRLLRPALVIVSQ